MYVTSGRTRVKAWAPAKLNLFLEIHGRRADGFHELETLMLPIGIWDTLTADLTNDSCIRLHAERAIPNRRRGDEASNQFDGFGRLPDTAQNLVFRAFELVRSTHCAPRGLTHGASVQLCKRIPSEAGLGGGSSDAAAALVLANRLWNLDLPHEELARLAAILGSDVPFFLYSATCVCRGRGEIVAPLTVPRRLFFVVVKPPVGLSTKRVFSKTRLPSKPKDSGAIANALHHGSVNRIGEHLFNRLQSSAMVQCESIERLAFAFDRLDVAAHQMTGSGSCYFGLCRNHMHARRLSQQLTAQNLGVAYAASTAAFSTSRLTHDHSSKN